MKNKTILIVGGAGFIGSHVNKMLNKAGYQTIVLDNLSNGNRSTVQNGEFIHGEMSDKTILDQIFQKNKIDAVMHFAAYIDVGESVLNPVKYYFNNVVNTLNLLTTMIDHHVKTFIFSSTAAIFGNPQTQFIDENHPMNPINPYGESKLMVEKILQSFDNAYGLKFTALRYFNAAGGDPEGKIKNFQTRSTNLIPIILKGLKSENGILTINGIDYPTSDGTCIRDYIHIEDLGSAHIQAMEKLFEGSHSDFFNLGNGIGFSIYDVIQAAESVTQKKVKFQKGPRRPGDPPFLVANSSKAIQKLGWKPKFSSLETIITDAWKAIE
ncbi:MAG: UDP-glucose 4-epimerase GalE [Parachlamydiaceae bacterium]|nr:UDP-glucose 4-epimerase GalE [Parachlamydiaceae bacterium]